MNYSRMRQMIATLKDRGEYTKDAFWFNIVTPFLQSLNYDVFNMNVSKVDFENKIMFYKIPVNNGAEEVIISSGIAPLQIDEIDIKGTPSYKVVTENKSIQYIYFDMENLKINVYVVVKGNNTIILSIDIDPERTEGAGNEEKKYNHIIKIAQKERVEKGYKLHGIKFFTAIVVMGLIAPGKNLRGNVFLEDVIKDLLKNPTNELMELISVALTEKYLYGDNTVERVRKNLMESKDDIYGVVGDVINKDMDIGFGDYDIGMGNDFNNTNNKTKANTKTKSGIGTDTNTNNINKTTNTVSENNNEDNDIEMFEGLDVQEVKSNEDENKNKETETKNGVTEARNSVEYKRVNNNDNEDRAKNNNSEKTKQVTETKDEEDVEVIEDYDDSYGYEELDDSNLEEENNEEVLSKSFFEEGSSKEDEDEDVSGLDSLINGGDDGNNSDGESFYDAIKGRI